MAVLKEFACQAHGPFDEIVNQGTIPSCPHGCSPRFVVREIRSAPSIRNVVTGTLDNLQRGIAHDFGLSDLKVKRDDPTSVMQNLREGKINAPQWVDVPNAMKSGWSGRGEAAAPVNVENQFGVKGDNMLNQVTLPKIETNIVGRYKADLPTV